MIGACMSTASHPASVTITNRPSVGQDGWNMPVIWSCRRSNENDGHNEKRLADVFGRTCRGENDNFLLSIFTSVPCLDDFRSWHGTDLTE